MTQEEWATELTNQTNGIIAAAWGMIVIAIIIGLILGLIQLIGTWKIFKKAGRKGWEAIIPFYNTWILIVEVAKLNWWWFLVLLIPSLAVSNSDNYKIIFSSFTLFVSLLANYNIAKKFHKDTGFAILMTIFPFILYPVIGCSKNYVYDDSVPVSKNGFINSKNTETNYNNQTTNNTNISYCPNCGTQINDGIKYCPNCGNEIK